MSVINVLNINFKQGCMKQKCHLISHDARAQKCKRMRSSLSLLCMTIVSREEGFATAVTEGRGAQCVCGRQRTSGRAVTDTLTLCLQSQRVDTLCHNNTERGDRAPERRRLMRPVIVVHVCQMIVFVCPGGGLEGDFEDSVLISTHMLPRWRQMLNC